MAPLNFNTSWIWHPGWTESPTSSSAGGFVDFRKNFVLDHVPKSPVTIRVSADTRYKLYINSRFVHAGPVKGDQQLWFFDELDIQPYLQQGENHIAIRVLRFYYATHFASSFPRTPTGGLLVQQVSSGDPLGIDTDETWETTIDRSARLPNKSKHDHFLQVFEHIDRQLEQAVGWTHAVQQRFLTDFGLSIPWRLSPRLIPLPRLEQTYVHAVHNIRSSEARESWAAALLQRDSAQVLLPAGSTHHVELEFEHHTTAYIEFRFLRPKFSGSTLSVTYSECYEDEPLSLPSFRVKADRRDSSKKIIGPSDSYVFGGPLVSGTATRHYDAEELEEVYAPFHFRTFRVIALDIQVAEGADLTLLGVSVTKTNYPLEKTADFRVPGMSWAEDLWKVSLRTLENCMHDCYEDCPFYEQLQYAMDVRSSALFTYCVSGDDRLARQAIIQLHNSFQPAVGLTASRAPCHHLQFIPHFSLFWACMLADHHEYFGDTEFVSQFLPVSHAVLEAFSRRIDAETGLVRNVEGEGEWHFVDWTEAWKPFGIPPAAERTGFQTFTSCLYAYTLQRLAGLLTAIGREGLVKEYTACADTIVQAIRERCFDGEYFTDGLASQAAPVDYSQHSQVWAILCGAATPEKGTHLLARSLAPSTTGSERSFTPASTAMSFYTMRALSLVGGDIYDAQFINFWDPWRAQLAQNLTTWVEDSVSQRSDCHAWGSLPLHEFTSEVVGVKPAAAGWKAISFKPRLGLFPEIDARVPVGGHLGSRTVRVRWTTGRDGTVKIVLSVEEKGEKGGDVPVHVSLPGRQSEVVHLEGDTEFVVDQQDIS
ncbi:hypothetical protein ACJ41O_001119 [Fusarium nematophilum]